MSKVTAGAKAKLNLEYCDEDVNLEDYNIPSDFNLEEVKSFHFYSNCKNYVVFFSLAGLSEIFNIRI